ncbi:DUF3040 domain-containing protein [Streptomyces sp. NPDC003007]
MNPEMNDGRIIAQLERRLAQDDPSLAALMDALNQQFPDEPGDRTTDCQKETGSKQETDSPEGTDSHEEEDERHSRWLVAITVFVIIAFLGLFITAVLNSNPQRTDKNPGPPQGLAPAAAVLAQRRSLPESKPRRRRSDTTLGHRTSGRPTTCPGGCGRTLVTESCPQRPS